MLVNEGLKANRTENIKFLFLLTLSLRRIYRLFAFGRELPYFVRIYRKLAWCFFSIQNSCGQTVGS